MLIQGLAEFCEPSTELFDHGPVRARISQHHIFFDGQRNETELPDKFPFSAHSVPTHGPRNIKVDLMECLTGKILDVTQIIGR